MGDETGIADQWGENFSGTKMDAYEHELMVPLFVPWAEYLLDLVEVDAGEAAIDVACGPGTVARLQAERVGIEGQVVACDFSEEMLSIARSKPPARGAPIEYRLCPAEALDAPSGAFDVLTCQQGYQFFSARSVALAEMRRVLRPGGRVAVAVWAEFEEMGPWPALSNAITITFGDDVAEAFRSGPWGLPDGNAIADEFRAAGFDEVSVRREVVPIELDGVDHLIRTLGAAPIWSEVAGLSDAAFQQFRDATDAACARWQDASGAIRGETTSHIITAKN
jgi:SAM-dependent methyltransferase